MKKLVFAAIAMMVMVSASNSFATKSATSMKGYNTAVADTAEVDTAEVDTTTTDSTKTPATPATPVTPAKPETV